MANLKLAVSIKSFGAVTPGTLNLTSEGTGGFYKPNDFRHSSASSTLSANAVASPHASFEATSLIGFSASNAAGFNLQAKTLSEAQGQSLVTTGDAGGTAYLAASIKTGNGLESNWYFYFKSGTNFRWTVESISGDCTSVVYDSSVFGPITANTLYKLTVRSSYGLFSEGRLVLRLYADAASSGTTAQAAFAAVTVVDLGKTTIRNGWHTVAVQPSSFTFNRPTLVRYGVPRNWATPKIVSGVVQADGSNFGGFNPNPNGPEEMQAQDPLYSTLRTKVMCIGDSITGFYAPELRDEIATFAEFSNVIFVGNAFVPPWDHNGYGGYKAANLLAPAGSGPGNPSPTDSGSYYGDSRDLAIWMQDQTPDYVVIHLGTNDRSSNNVSAVLQAYSLLLAAVRQNNPVVRVVVCKIIPCCEDDGTPAPAWAIALGSAAQTWAAANTTTDSPIFVADCYTGFNPTKYNASTNPSGQTRDNLHPTASYDDSVSGNNGTQFMARRVITALRAAGLGT